MHHYFSLLSGSMLSFGLLVLLQLIAFVRFIYRQYRDSQINRKFIKAIATNHLPHVQKSLDIIAARVGVVLPEAPPLDWVDLENGKR